MGNLKQRTPQQARTWADRALPRLVSLWDELPDIAAEIESWDAGEALMYIEELPLYEDQRAILNAYAEDGVLTADQRAQLERLNQIARERRPILSRLLRVSEPSVP